MTDELFQKLRALNIATVTIEYGGSGDEGNIYSIEMRDSAHARIHDDPLYEELSDAAYNFLYAKYGSFGDGDGCEGRLELNIASNTIEIHYGWYENVLTYDKPETTTPIRTLPI